MENYSLTFQMTSSCWQGGYFQPAPCLAFPPHLNSYLRWTEQKPGSPFCRRV